MRRLPRSITGLRSYGQPGNLTLDDRQQRAKADLYRAPHKFFRHVVIVMAVHITGAHDGTPRQLRMPVTHRRGKPTSGLRNNLKAARHCVESPAVSLERVQG